MDNKNSKRVVTLKMKSNGCNSNYSNNEYDFQFGLIGLKKEKQDTTVDSVFSKPSNPSHPSNINSNAYATKHIDSFYNLFCSLNKNCHMNRNLKFEEILKCVTCQYPYYTNCKFLVNNCKLYFICCTLRQHPNPKNQDEYVKLLTFKSMSYDYIDNIEGRVAYRHQCHLNNAQMSCKLSKITDKSLKNERIQSLNGNSKSTDSDVSGDGTVTTVFDEIKENFNTSEPMLSFSKQDCINFVFDPTTYKLNILKNGRYNMISKDSVDEEKTFTIDKNCALTLDSQFDYFPALSSVGCDCVDKGGFVFDLIESTI